MSAIKIIADSTQEALEQVQSQVGADAVILNVRKVPAEGVKKIWSKPRIEVIAEAPAEARSQKDALRQLAGKVRQLEGCLLYTSPSPRDKRQSRMPSSA